MEFIPEEDMAGLNPFPELLLPARDGRPGKWVALNYHLMRHGQGAKADILVTAEDISGEKAMAAKAAEIQNENSHLRAIAETRTLPRLPGRNEELH
jgi:hypothetical protein